MRVLLTGATGFIGRHLAAALVERGDTVRAAVRAPPAPGILPEGTEIIPGIDLEAPVQWAPHMAGVDAVVHAAGIAHAGEGIPKARYFQVNRAATTVLGAAARGRVARFVLLSSIRAQTGPSAPDVLTETSPAEPTDAYGRSKLAAEEALAALDLPWTALRPVVVYGPRVGGNMAALRRLARLPVPLPFGRLHTPRSLLSIDNLVAAVLFSLDSPTAEQAPLIVADPAPIALSAIVATLRRAEGRNPALIGVPPGLLSLGLRLVGRGADWERLSGSLVVDPSRLVSLGWRPPVGSTQQGLERWVAAEPVPG
ncbi:MAG: NAD-dependent epimerase/dehydratase family protein [Alsobacter sp.]